MFYGCIYSLWSWIVNVYRSTANSAAGGKKKNRSCRPISSCARIRVCGCVVGALLNLQYCIKVLARWLFDNPQKLPHFVKFFLFSHVYERTGSFFFFFFFACVSFLSDENWRKTKVFHPGASADLTFFFYFFFHLFLYIMEPLSSSTFAGKSFLAARALCYYYEKRTKRMRIKKVKTSKISKRNRCSGSLFSFWFFRETSTNFPNTFNEVLARAMSIFLNRGISIIVLGSYHLTYTYESYVLSNDVAHGWRARRCWN